MQREAFFDNAKWILIFFVVFGHTIQPFVEKYDTIYVLYQWIYTFHMPAFIFLAGYFAKPSGSKGYVGKLVKKLLFPYVMFQSIYTIYYFLIGKQDWLHTPFEPHWSLWFLVSLLCWHIMLYWFYRLPKHLALLITVQLGLLVGYIDVIGHSFSLSRTFVFFPFFLLGYWFGPDQLKWLRQKNVRALSLLVLGLSAAAITIAPRFSTSWFLGSKSYLEMGMPEWGGLIRLGIYILSILMMFSVLAWMPRKKGVWTKYGGNTLYVYLLHGFFIHFFREFDVFQLKSPLDMAVLITTAAMITWGLSSRPVRNVASPFIEWEDNSQYQWKRPVRKLKTYRF